MRYHWLGTMALAASLAACGDAGKQPSPADNASTSSVTDSAGQPASAGAVPVAAGGAALLDGLIDPRQKGRFAPRDECGKEAGATEFRRKLTDAVAASNTAAISALASPQVKLGFGGNDGREQLVKKLSEPDSELLEALRRLLPMGCAVDQGGNLVMPWYFAQDPGVADSYSAMIVTAQDVPLLTKGDTTSPVGASLSWDIVELIGGLDKQRSFQQVRTSGGKTGFVATERLRSLLDYRLLASRESGEWKITALLAGD